MLGIAKGSGPACLESLRATPGADWGSVPGPCKHDMRQAAWTEQGGLCAYCMRRVENRLDKNGRPTMDIEHWDARSGGAAPFHWPHLLGVCKGDLGAAHCDKSRGDKPLRLHPARDPETEALTRYLVDGTIEIDGHDAAGRPRRKANEPDVRALNLNNQTLKGNRKQVLDAVLARSTGADATRIRAQIAAWESRDPDGRRPEYAGVALYFLKRALKDREAKGKRLRSTPRS